MRATRLDPLRRAIASMFGDNRIDEKKLKLWTKQNINGFIRQNGYSGEKNNTELIKFLRHKFKKDFGDQYDMPDIKKSVNEWSDKVKRAGIREKYKNENLKLPGSEFWKQFNNPPKEVKSSNKKSQGKRQYRSEPQDELPVINLPEFTVTANRPYRSNNNQAPQHVQESIDPMQYLDINNIAQLWNQVHNIQAPQYSNPNGYYHPGTMNINPGQVGGNDMYSMLDEQGVPGMYPFV